MSQLKKPKHKTAQAFFKKTLLLSLIFTVIFTYTIADSANANFVSKPISIAAKKVAKDLAKNTAVEMANQIVSEFLVKELIEGVKTDDGYSAVCMDGKKDNIKDCAPEKRAQVKTKLSDTDKSNLSKKVESVLEKKTLTSSKWGKFLDFFVPIFLISGAVELISSAIDGDILSFFDEIGQEALIESGFLKPLGGGQDIELTELIDFSSVIASAEVEIISKDAFSQYFKITTVNKAGKSYEILFKPSNLSLQKVTASTSMGYRIGFTTMGHAVPGSSSQFINKVTTSTFGVGGSLYSMSSLLVHQSTVIYPTTDLAREAGHSYISSKLFSDFQAANGDVNKLMNLYVAYIRASTTIEFNIPTYIPTPPEVKTDYGTQTATEKLKDPNGKVQMKGIDSFTFTYGDTHIYPSGDSQTGWKDKTTGEDITVVEDDVVVDDKTDTETQPKPEEDPDKVKDKVGSQLGEFLPKEIILALLDMLRSILAFMVRTFSFILTIPSVQALPINSPGFEWFMNAKIMGFRIFPLVQSFAIFTFGFAIYRVVKKVF